MQRPHERRGLGAQVFVDPCTSYMESRWLLVREAGEAEPWFAWARVAGDHRFLERPAGAVHVYAEGRYEIVAVIVGVLAAPPGPLSA